MNLQGKTALVTGASRGIGRAIAIALAANGIHRILLVARNAQRLEEVAADIAPLGVETVVLPMDLTESVSVSVAIAQAWRQHGPIDLLVNCAGVAHQTTFVRSQLPHVQAELATNLVGLYTITRMVARRMVAHRRGYIVNVSSLMGKIAAPTFATYSATKFAIVGFTQALRAELAPYNVRVSALLPSLTDTEMVEHMERFRGVQTATPEQVAEALIQGLKRDQPEILVGVQSHLAVWCDRLAPWLVERIVRLAAPAIARSYRPQPSPSGAR